MSEEVSRLFRFGVIGFLVAGIYVLGFAGLSALGLAPFTANTIAFLIAVAVQYVGQTVWTFRSKLLNGRQSTRFMATIALGVVYSSVLTALVGPALGWQPVVSAGIVAVTLPAINYVSFRLWVFGLENTQEEK